MRRFLLALAALLVVSAGTTQRASAAWAPTSRATITPGVQMLTSKSQCTANFVFKDKRGRVYVGYAAHCAGLGRSDDINGCTTRSLPLGTPVSFVRDDSVLFKGEHVGRGKLAYSSWLTMQRLHTKDPNLCIYNDFALVRVVKRDRGKVNPTVPFWGGPSGLRSTPLRAGEAIHGYGNSGLRSGLLNEQTGTVHARVGRGWAYEIETFSPGIPGDSGAGYLDGSGRAVGVLSTLGVYVGPPAVRNTMGSLYHELAWARKHSGIRGLRLVKGTEAFAAP